VLSLTFDNTAEPFSMYGEPLTVGAGGIVNQDADAQSLQNDMSLSAPQAWHASAGDLRFFGNIANGGHLLTVDEADCILVYGNITGSGGLEKNGAGAMRLYGGGSGWYSGATTVNAGSLILHGDSTWTAPFFVEAGGRLTFDSGTHTFGFGASVTGGGNVTFHSSWGGTSWL
jgi:autotransporter-associated beta strand protein